MRYQCFFTDENGASIIGESEYLYAQSHEEAAMKFVENKSDFPPFTKVLCDQPGSRVINNINFKKINVEKYSDTINNDEPSTKKNNLTPDVSSWAMIHYAVGGICLIVFLIALSEDSDSDAQLMITLAIGCFIFGTILQSLKTICFYLREIYKRMD